MKAMDLADYVIIKANELNKPVPNLKLQKVMYFLNAYYMLNNKGKALIEDESFERWDYGPTIRSVYYEYSSNGASPIKSYIKHINIHRDNNNNIVDIDFSEGLDINSLDREERKFIDKHINELLRFNPFDLVNESHKETQWKELSNNEEYSNIETLKYYKKNKFW